MSTRRRGRKDEAASYAFGLSALGQRCALAADYSGRKPNFFEGNSPPVTFEDIGFFIKEFQCHLLLDARLSLLRPCKPFCSRSNCWWNFSLEQVDISRTYQVTSLLLGAWMPSQLVKLKSQWRLSLMRIKDHKEQICCFRRCTCLSIQHGAMCANSRTLS